MRLMSKYKEQILESLALLFPIFFFWGNRIQNFFWFYHDTGFDAQNVMTWEYTNIMRFMPYKDFFYPYGALIFYKDQSTILNIVYFSLFPLFFLSIFFILKKLYNDRFLTYIVTTVFFLFLLRFIDFDTFIRYGGLASFTLVIAYIFYNFSSINIKIIFIAGLYTGIIFSLITDLGIYSGLIFFVFLILYILRLHFTQTTKQHLRLINNSIVLLKSTGIFILGVFMGFIPYLIFLIYKGILLDFFISVYKLQEITLYAKTPFLPGIKSLDNIFTLTILFISIFHLSYKFIYAKLKVSLSDYLQFGITIVLLLLEQKSVIRSIDKQITFIAFLLLCILLYNFKQSTNLSRNKFLFFTCLFSLLILFSFGFTPISFFQNRERISPSEFINKMNTIYAKNTAYAEIKKKLITEPHFNGKVFSFPADPLFYVLFHQKPPYYFTLYETSPKANQLGTIRYIEDQHIQYAIYNTKIIAIQDGVPDYIRGTLELQYLLNHFIPVDKIGEYIILKRMNSNKDMFHDSSDISHAFVKQFEHIDLAAIPEEEGVYKKTYIPKATLTFPNLTVANDYLSNHSVNSSDKLILLRFNNSKLNTTMRITTDEGLGTTIEFYSCKKDIPCIIHLQSIPLFYLPRIIKKIAVDNSSIQSIQFAQISNNDVFW